MTGDSLDILDRVKKLIPKRWFTFVAPYRDAIIGGLADGAAWCYSLIVYARKQSRLKTSSGLFLDLAAWDFFQGRLTRRIGEIDTSLQTRIIKEIVRPRQIRAAILQALSDLTGRAGQIFEPWNPGDCGGYHISTSGYGMAGCYGSLQFRNQIFVTAYRPLGAGIPNVSGYGNPQGGYNNVGSQSAYSDYTLVAGPVLDSEIYARVAETVAAGVTAWVAIKS